MDNSTKRTLLFLVGCIGSRTLLAYLAKTVSLSWLNIMGYLALIPAMGFLVIYVFGLRKTGPEVFGEQIWWNHLRPVHSLLYFVFAYHAIHRKSYAWVFLAADVVIGLLVWLCKRYCV